MNLDFPVHVPPQPVTASLRRELCLVLRETLNNVLKHARATEVVVQFRFRCRDGVKSSGPNDLLELNITDNGCGFELGKASDRNQPRGGNGLANLRARMESFGGSLKIESAPGQGTRLIASVRLSG